MTSFAVSYDAADHLVDGEALVIQFVSPPLAAQTIANNPIRSQYRGTEVNANNNQKPAYKLYLIDKTGAAVSGGTLHALKVSSNLSGEFPTSTLTNKSNDSTMTLGPITCSAGDRIVCEVGAGGLPTASGGVQGHNFTISIGEDSATDLANDETTTTADNPWVEFATDTLVFMRSYPIQRHASTKHILAR